MFRLLIILLLAILPLMLRATDTLTLIQFHDIVLSNHPLAKSAKLYNEIAESYLIKGRGALDSKLYADYDGKQFKDLNYFRRWHSVIKIPSKYPVDFSIGYENNSGDFLNNDSSLPNNGLIYGSLSISVLRGLLFDEQRFALKESQLLADKSQIEKELIIRQVLVQSMNAYVEWSVAHGRMLIANSYRDRVLERHNFIRQLYENGDRPAIDTIESRINLNSATKMIITAAKDLLVKKQKLNLFLWDNTGEPMVLLDGVLPQNITDITERLLSESLLISQNWNTDPIIRKKQIDIDHITLRNRLEQEQLKPQLDIKLNTIHNLAESEWSYNYRIQDYKLGVSVALPITNRKTRGQIKLNEALIEQNKLDQEYHQYKLQNLYNTLWESSLLCQQALSVSIEKIENSKMLYSAELLKFELGESSVFLLNSRERKLLEAQNEYIKNLRSLSFIYNELYFLKLGQEKNSN